MENLSGIKRLTMTNNNNSIADSVPMNLEQMREYLQEHFGVPRQKGTTSIKCPYCLKMHVHVQQPGHHVGGCDDNDRFCGIGIVVEERYFSQKRVTKKMTCLGQTNRHTLHANCEII